ncbi:MAG: hypothetical protein ABIO45_07365 [Burkholderiaceae bacterium]
MQQRGVLALYHAGATPGIGDNSSILENVNPSRDHAAAGSFIGSFIGNCEKGDFVWQCFPTST